ERRGKNKVTVRSLAKCSRSSTTACATARSVAWPRPREQPRTRLSACSISAWTPTPRGEVDELLEPEESCPNAPCRALSSAKECPAPRLPRPGSTNPGAQPNKPHGRHHRQPRALGSRTHARPTSTNTLTRPHSFRNADRSEIR